jgi:hypothetical protein
MWSRSEFGKCSSRGSIYTDNPITVNSSSTSALKCAVRANDRTHPHPGPLPVGEEAVGGSRACVGTSRLGSLRRERYLTFKSSTSNSKVAFGGMSSPAPRAP